MTDAEVVDVLSFARGFPSIPPPEVDRDHLLDTLDRLFLTDVLLVEGDEGVGKTVLLSQFAKRHRQNTISLFLRPASLAAIDPTYISVVLAEQLHWMLYGEALHAEFVSERSLQNYFASLDRRLHRANKKCFVVVDGLEDETFWRQNFGESILAGLLPLGMNSYKYLITDRNNRIASRLHASIKVRPYYLSFCSFDEAKRYLSGLDLAEADIQELYKACRKNFGRLADVRRLIQSGTPQEKLLTEAFPDFFDLEWHSIEGQPGWIEQVLAVVAFAQCPYVAQTIAEIVDYPEEDVRAALRCMTFLLVDNDSGEVTFCSEAHRRFAQAKLRAVRDLTLANLIEHHRHFSTATQLSPLPQYFHDAQKHNELLAHLNTKYFLGIASSTQSLTALERATRLGIDSGSVLEDPSALIRFCTQAGFLAEVRAAETSRAEIRARIQLGDRQLAIALAERASLKEDRLALLVAAAAALKKYSGESDTVVLNQIESLCDQVDFEALGDRTIEIASELVTVNPDLSFKMIQRSAHSNQNAASIDEAFAKLTFHAIAARNDRRDVVATADHARAKVKDPLLQQFLMSVSLFLETTSAQEVIRHAKSLAPSEALLFLRQWAESTTAYDKVEPVLEFALDLAIRTTEYTPKIAHLRELSTPLPKMTDCEAIQRLVVRFDSLRLTILDLGTNEDLTRLQLHLAAAEARLDAVRARQRLMELYWAAAELKNLPAKAACLSWMLSYYRHVDKEGVLERLDQFETVLQEDLDSCLREVLRTSADHYVVVKAAVRALARRDTTLAMGIARSLNTLERRNRAYFEIVRYACRPAVARDRIETLFEAANHIEDYEVKSQAIAELVAAYCRMPSEHARGDAFLFERMVDACESICWSSSRALALADLYGRGSELDLGRISSLDDILVRVHNSWVSIDSAWNKATAAFEIASILGKRQPTVARQYVERGEAVRKAENIIAASQFEQYACVVRLATRAFVGLLASRSEGDMLRTIAKVIDVIPSRRGRAYLWADLACRSFLVERHDVCETIVNERIKPVLEQMSRDNSGAVWWSEVAVAPALYAAHVGTALERIEALPSQVCEEAASNILQFLLRRTPLDDPYIEKRTTRRKLKYEQVVDLFPVLRKISTDSALYAFTSQICDRATQRGALTRQQMADIGDRIEKEIAAKFPDARNIEHEGYLIVTLAQVGRLKVYAEHRWQALVEQAERITNIADQAFVLTELAEAMAPRFKQLAESVLRRAKTLVDTMSVNIDRADRYLSITRAAFDIDRALAKDCARSAYTYACEDPDENFVARRRRILDIANLIDPAFAESLVGVVDDDTTRAMAKREGREHLRVLALEKALTSRDAGLTNTKEEHEELTEGAWRALGLLNADWTEPRHIEELRPYIKLCADLPLVQSAFPILAWTIESQRRRMAMSPAGRATFGRLAQALVEACEAAIAIIGTTGQLDQMLSPSFRIGQGSQEESGIVIGEGERQKALDVIRTWASDIEGYVKICDPYFSLQDLDLIRLLRSCDGDVRIIVLAAKGRQEATDLQSHYVEAWHRSIAADLPGNCDIFFTGTADGAFPIHDRWMISSDGGLRIGTSYSGLGIGKTSEISRLSALEARTLEEEIDAILQRTRREYKGKPLGLTVAVL